MARRSTPPFRADHVGSLLRPPALHQARASHAAAPSPRTSSARRGRSYPGRGPDAGGSRADGYFLEYDDDRSGTFEPLRFVPPGKIVVLGLVTTKTPALESADDLKRRVEQAARYVDADRLCLSPQCGFASTVDGNALTLDQQRAKLDLIVRAAAEIWG
jgi:methionine synthase II (cobalamin-independent)